VPRNYFAGAALPGTQSERRPGNCPKIRRALVAALPARQYPAPQEEAYHLRESAMQANENTPERR